MKNIELICEQNNVRINKFLADHKVCSRREADRNIKAGKVKINLAHKKNELYVKAMLGDMLSIGDKVTVTVEESQYYIYNKAKNEVAPPYIISANIRLMTSLPKSYAGIMLYSDDSNLSEIISNSNKIDYEYIVRTRESINKLSVDRLLGGVTYEGIEYKKAKKAKIIDEAGRTLLLSITEYRENIISRILDAVRLNVESVTRTHIGKIGISNMDVSTYKSLNIGDLIK